MKINLRLLLTLFFALLMQISFAQEKAISGLVTDSNGISIPGVNVNVKGSKGGVQTDFDGKFSIKVQTGDVLVFSFVGMRNKEALASAGMTVKMIEDAQTLEGVVVTALGIKREKKSLGYGTQKVDGDEVNKLPSSNFINNLSGKVSGLQIKTSGNLGGSTNVVIRGYKSIGGTNQALFVIDGIPLDNSNNNGANQINGRIGYDYGNAASDINPDDIESINVLKGAAATALYGSRAANGAIMIVTKKGKSGQKGIGVSFNSSVSVGSVDKSTFVDYQTQYGQGYFGNRFRTSVDINGDGLADTSVRTGDDASYGPAYNSGLQVYQWDSFIPESPNYKKATPWKIANNTPITFFENPISVTNTIALNGANEHGTYNFSYTNFTATGLLPNSKQDKNSFIGNASYKLSDRLTATFMANYINTKTLGRNGTGYNGNIVSNFRQWWATNADIGALKDIYFNTNKNYTWNATSFSNSAPAYWNNPYFERYESYQNDNRNRIIGNASLNYKLTDALNVTGQVSVDTYSEVQQERLANGSYGGNSFGIAQSNESSGYQKFIRDFAEYNYDLMLNFNKDLTSKFNIKGVAGINVRRNNSNSTLSSTSGGLFVPRLYSLNNSVNPVESPLETETKRGVDGVYISASLGYDNFLFLDGTYRRDVSSTLPKGGNVYKYPSISTSFLFSNLLNLSWLDLGKIRIGYAEVGNDALYNSLKDAFVKPSPFTSPLFSVASTKNNPNLEPERTNSWELGLEMQFFKKRVGFDFSAYKTNTINQITPISVSEATGYSTLIINAGNIENKGLEATLSITPFKTDNFRWDIITNWSKNISTVKELYPGITNLQLGNFQGGVSVNATVGQPYGMIQGSDYEYLNGQRVVDPSTGKYVISSTNDKNLGTFTPEWIGGINNKFTYKNVTLSFLVDVQKGGKVFSLDRWYGEGTGLYSNTVGTNDLGQPIRNTLANGGGVVLPGVFADGTPNNVRLDTSNGLDGYFGYLGSANSDYVYDASYIKLREATLGYTFSKKTLGNSKIQELYLGLSGNNLWIIQKNLPDADPEAGLGSGNVQGFQSGVLPVARTIAFNLKVKF